MRLNIELNFLSTYKILPVNYQYPLSAWIYKTIHYANPDFANWLHEKGYTFEKRNFKLFCFSPFQFRKYRIFDDRIESLTNNCQLTLSFLVPETIQHFVKGCFINQYFSIGDSKSKVDFNVKSIEIFKAPVFTNQMSFRTQSPVCISRSKILNEKQQTEYLSPLDENYSTIVFNNLKKKYKALYDIDFQDNNFIFKIHSEPQSKLITVAKKNAEPVKFRAFLFDFEITAPPEIIKIGYYAGFGEKNSLGSGFVVLR